MSSYLMAPGVERATIGVYPKRQGHSSFPREERKMTRADSAAEVLTIPPQPRREVCYADFFRTPAVAAHADVA